MTSVKDMGEPKFSVSEGSRKDQIAHCMILNRPQFSMRRQSMDCSPLCIAGWSCEQKADDSRHSLPKRNCHTGRTGQNRDRDSRNLSWVLHRVRACVSACVSAEFEMSMLHPVNPPEPDNCEPPTVVTV